MPVRIAILDLYDGEPNEGMRAIRELIADQDRVLGGGVFEFDVFDVRVRGEVPGLDHDIYLSSGGPGSPFSGEGKRWEADYFACVDDIWNHNERLPADSASRKHLLFICHSFQMMCRFFALARVVKRRSEAFGIFATEQTEAGRRDPLFDGLPDPFFAADFRGWQVVQPSDIVLAEFGGTVLAIEKERPHIPLERALMAIRISPEIVGVQFHPEADPSGMTLHFSKPDRKRHVIRHHGEDKYNRILRHMGDENFLKRTHDAVVPNFLRQAVDSLRPEDVAAGPG